MAGMDPSSRSFTLALGLSVLLHAVVLSIQFKLPGLILDKLVSPSLEVVLVNSKTRAKPVKANVLAQANLDGGGNTDENRRAKTPLPVLKEAEPGADARSAARRVQELEARQLKMMTQLKAAKDIAAAEEAKAASTAQVPQPPVSGQELATNALAMARMEAQIARQIEEYNQRPRKKFIGSRAQEYRFAQYVEDWRLKVERIGNLNYPDNARGKVYGSLVLTVSIKSDGNLDKVEVRRSSGQQILDRAAERIVKMASPYARFPDNIKRDTDILVITRTWTFAPGDRLFGE
ncbi:MAG: TonB family protein [Burkholderiales bacterium]|nr:TonB family protein [Burkholderiales bacterium]